MPKTSTVTQKVMTNGQSITSECIDKNDLKKIELETDRVKEERGTLGKLFGVSSRSYVPVVGLILCLLIILLFVLLFVSMSYSGEKLLTADAAHLQTTGCVVYYNNHDSIAKTALTLIVPIISMGIGLLCANRHQ